VIRGCARRANRRPWGVRLWPVVLLSCWGCYHPSPPSGSPCDALHPCPSTYVCSPPTQTCELSASEADAAVTVQPDAPAAPANDNAAGAVDISAGGTFTANVTSANDSASPPGNNSMGCASAYPGRDVFYKLHLDRDEAIYLDTFGSDYDTLIRVYKGPCVDGPAPNGTVCHDDMCGTPQTQAIWDMHAGDNCIVVDQSADPGPNGALILHVERGLRTGRPLTLGTPVVGTTVGASDQSQPPCAMVTGPDQGYYYTVCPNVSKTFVATTCNNATNFDDALYLRGPGGNIARCRNNDPTCQVDSLLAGVDALTVTGPHMVWIIVDAGTPDDSGNYEIDTILQ
jgi:hypothetical protein